MDDRKLNEYKKWFESKGYDFEDEFWMEDYVADHKFMDIIQLINDYHEEQIKRIDNKKTIKWNTQQK